MTECRDAGPSTIRNSTYVETPDIRSQGSKSNLDNGFYALKSVVTPQATEGDAGSPIDVAKSYMRARPSYSGGGTSFSSAK
ncbi:hypothetical protein Tco_1470115, partial [Tanacetum coccineum]